MYTCYCCNVRFTGVASNTGNMCPPCALLKTQEKVLDEAKEKNRLLRERNSDDTSNEVVLTGSVFSLFIVFWVFKPYRWLVILSTILHSWYYWEPAHPVRTVLLYFVVSLIFVFLAGVILLPALATIPKKRLRRFIDAIKANKIIIIIPIIFALMTFFVISGALFNRAVFELGWMLASLLQTLVVSIVLTVIFCLGFFYMYTWVIDNKFKYVLLFILPFFWSAYKVQGSGTMPIMYEILMIGLGVCALTSMLVGLGYRICNPINEDDLED